MNFNEIIGQKAIKATLKEALARDHIAHAWMFEGPGGIGKKTVAFAFAQALLCENRGTPGTREGITDFPGACGDCRGCTMFRMQTHPDFHFYSTDEENIKVKEIRNFFSSVNITPHYARKKVYIINQAEKMNTESQNCILKTLEEPPGDVVIILLTSNAEALLETIKSRTLRYSFERYTRQEILEVTNNYKKGRDQAETEDAGFSDDFIISFSDGILGRALEIIESKDFRELRDKSFEVIQMLESGDLKKRFAAAEILQESGRNLKTYMEFFMSYYRDLLVMSISEDITLLINADKKDIILNGRAKISTNGIINAFSLIREALFAIERNANEGLVVERFIIKLQEEYK